MDTGQVAREDHRLLIFETRSFGGVCPFRLASCLEGAGARDQDISVDSEAMCWCFANHDIEGFDKVVSDPRVLVSSSVLFAMRYAYLGPFASGGIRSILRFNCGDLCLWYGQL